MSVAALQTTKYPKRNEAESPHQIEGLLKARCSKTECCEGE